MLETVAKLFQGFITKKKAVLGVNIIRSTQGVACTNLFIPALTTDCIFLFEWSNARNIETYIRCCNTYIVGYAVLRMIQAKGKINGFARKNAGIIHRGLQCI